MGIGQMRPLEQKTEKSASPWAILKRADRRKKGSSLAEMLVTVVLMGIVLSATASGMGALISSYRKIVLKSEALTLMSTLTTAIDAELKSAVPMVDESTGKRVMMTADGFIDSGLRGYRIRFGVEDTSPEGEKSFSRIVFRYGTEAEGASGDVIPVVSDGAYTKKLSARLVASEEPSPGTPGSPEGEETGIRYADGCFSYTLEISDRSGESTPLIREESAVRPINLLNEAEE